MARTRRPSGNLPAELTSFVGRRQQLGEIRKKLTAARLVSLVGPGGAGKSRLALRIAADLARGFADGAWLVELAEVRDGALVATSGVGALDLRDQAGTQPAQILSSYLQEKRLLLVVDNCDPLLGDSAQLVPDILRAAPNVRVITTSRVPLGVRAEQVVAAPPLELPAGNGTESLAQLRRNEAVMLFTERAAAASGAFALTTENQAAIVGLCRRLDGLPLAIELAAVRTRALAAEQILERLSDRFALLTGGSRVALPRHQTLETTIDWSYELLGNGEQALLRRLCVFAGRFTLEDVEAVCTSDNLPAAEALDTMTSLVDKSLVTKEDVRSLACYRLHETMREYATLKLRGADEERVLEERCLEYYRATCLQSVDQARYRLVKWLAWADLEIDNIRAVLHQCVARGDLARGLDIAASMGYYWITHGTTESTRWLDQLLGAEDAAPATQVRAYYLRGWLSLLQADAATARPWIARAVTTARETRQLTKVSESLSIAATVESVAGDLEAARRYLEQAEEVTAHLRDFPATVELLLSRAVLALVEGDLETARAVSLEGVRLSREAGDLYQVEAMLGNLGMVGVLAGDPETAKSRFAEALQVARQTDNRLGQSWRLAGLGWYAANSGQGRGAAQLLGAAQAGATGGGAGLMGPAVPLLAEAKESAIGALGAPKFEAEFEAGKHMTRDMAVGLAFWEGNQDELGAGDPVSPGLLPKRQAEVAQLIAEGLSNKQIGARLFISEATVATHVRGIMNKLGFNSRAQIASWIASPKL